MFPRFLFSLIVFCLYAGSLFALEPENRLVNKGRMIKTVRFLSETNFPRTVSPENKEKTIDYIVQALKMGGLNAIRNEFAIKQILSDLHFPESSANDDSVAIEMHAMTFTNIHAVKKGRTNKRIIIGAHYDAIPESPGADDNASAVAALIELAYLLKNCGELNCDIELVAYDLEEAGLLGSQYHAKKLKNQKIDVVCMFSLDMVGYYSDASHSQEYPVRTLSLLYGTQGNFLVLTGKPKDAELLKTIHKAFQRATTLKVISAPVPLGMEILLGRSDHGYFWKEGFPAFFITDTAEYRNKNYHKPTDTWDTLDYDRLAEVPVGLYNAVRAIDAAQIQQ